MNRLALLALVLSASVAGALQPSPTPDATPAPVASPSPTATPAATPTPTPAAPVPEQASPEKPAPTTREAVDALSAGELQDAITILKGNYISPESLSEEQLSRATLQGLLERIGPGASILLEPSKPAAESSPFRAEILDDRIGYLRLGELSKDRLAELDAALKNFATKNLTGVILDLRATPASANFELAAEVIERFCPKGRMLFTVKKPGAKQERIYTSRQDSQVKGVSVAMIDEETAGAAEVIAAALRKQARTMIVGQTSAGQAVEYTETPLKNGKLLRVAVSEVSVPESEPIFQNGVKPDIEVDVPAATRRTILAESLEKGVSGFVFETERARLNEAALVAGTNPEVDAAQNGKSDNQVKTRDVMLQRAVDLITTISIYAR